MPAPMAGFRIMMIHRSIWILGAMLALSLFPGAVAADGELTDREMARLASRKEIVFVSQSRYPPFEFIDAKGERAGADDL